MKIYALIFYCLIFITCSIELKDSNKIPISNDRSNIENLTTYSLDQEAYTVVLVKKAVFESNEDVLIDGLINSVAIDSLGRVFISGGRPGNVKVYVFNPDGTYLTRFGRYGRGPGEFEALADIYIKGDLLYMLGSRLQKIAIFSLKDFSLINDELIKKNDIKDKNKFISLMRAYKIHGVFDGELYLGFQVSVLGQMNLIPKLGIYRVSKDGIIYPDVVLEQDKYRFYIPPKDKKNGTSYGFTTPFTRESLVQISQGGEFYTNWTEDFLIKTHNKEGNFERAFYYEYPKQELSIENLGLSRSRLKVIEEQGIPRTWPVVHEMIIDEKERLWVATISESNSTYKWWVLNKYGELIARFIFQGERSMRNPFGKAYLTLINGEYLYNREYDYSKGIDRIIKYKIEFKEREQPKELVLITEARLTIIKPKRILLWNF